MTETLNAVLGLLISLADKYTWLVPMLLVIGGAYVLLMLLQPVVVLIARLTKTDKDDAICAKVYDFLTDYGPCFATVADLFKKKTGWPSDVTKKDNK